MYYFGLVETVLCIDQFHQLWIKFVFDLYTGPSRKGTL